MTNTEAVLRELMSYFDERAKMLSRAGQGDMRDEARHAREMVQATIDSEYDKEGSK